MNRTLIVLFVLLGLVWPSVAYQQAPFVFCDQTGCTLTNLLSVPVRIFNWLLGLAGFVLLAMIVWAGVRMILYYVSDQPEMELMSAKLTLRRGIFGFLIIAFAFLIVNTLVYTIFGISGSTAFATWLTLFGIIP